jgi:carbonic anhydrase/acetyltransferase-like protein (isoleucine patch superfamily)
MLESFDGREPKIAESAYVHLSACIRGDVEIGEHSIIWPGATITGDWGRVRIGRCTIIEDNCAVHVATIEDWKRNTRGLFEIGDNVTVGHGAVLHGRRIGNRVMVGMNATILQNVDIGDECVIAAGAVLTEGMKVPRRSFVAGVPAKIKSELRESHAYWVGEGYEANDDFYAEYIRKLKASVVLT